jgi:AP-2 complex subunit sigma-1
MIRFFVLMNKQGKTRLSKWYLPPPSDSERVKMESEIHRLIVLRERKHTNFVEFENFKIVYRRYAGLFFIFGEIEMSIYL